MVGVGIDLARWGAVWREAGFAADAGAEAGAAMVDAELLYKGVLALDPATAEWKGMETARAARPRPERRVDAHADPDQVCVTVHQTFRPTILRAVGVADQTVTVDACAEPHAG